MKLNWRFSASGFCVCFSFALVVVVANVRFAQSGANAAINVFIRFVTVEKFLFQSHRKSLCLTYFFFLLLVFSARVNSSISLNLNFHPSPSIYTMIFGCFFFLVLSDTLFFPVYYSVFIFFIHLFQLNHISHRIRSNKVIIHKGYFFSCLNALTRMKNCWMHCSALLICTLSHFFFYFFRPIG